MRIKRTKKKGPVASKKVIYKDIELKSGLELYMYKALESFGLDVNYEKETFELIASFHSHNDCFEKQSNGKGDFKNRGGSKVRGITYTPDFTDYDYIIECKGRPNDSFPIKWKIFKKHLLLSNDKRTIYKPQNQKDCDEVVKLIIENRQKTI